MRSFWWLLTFLSVGWYLTVTVYIAVRGAVDIRQMLARLKADAGRNSERAALD